MQPEAKSRVEHELFIRSFMSINPTSRVMSQLTLLMRDEYFEPGQVMYERGHPAQHIYFVVSGRVELASEEGDAWVLENESVVGLLDASRERDYSRTATAKAFTHAIVLNFADYLDVLEQNFDYARNCSTEPRISTNAAWLWAARTCSMGWINQPASSFEGWNVASSTPSIACWS